jgi:DNA-directed RNA polymerase specialized sigma24 family protein
VELRYFDAASFEQIAQALSVGTINARRIVFNALTKLRQCVRSLQTQEVA